MIHLALAVAFEPTPVFQEPVRGFGYDAAGALWVLHHRGDRAGGAVAGRGPRRRRRGVAGGGAGRGLALAGWDAEAG